MHQGKLVFAQVMAHLPLSTFRRCVARHDGEHKVKSFSCLDQFYAMAFAQLTFRESLRDIGACLATQGRRLYHLGFRSPVARNTLANANAVRPWQIYADLAEHLIGVARPLYASEPIGLDLKETVYAFDATTIDLCLSVYPWAPFRSAKAAIKLHTLLDVRGSIPSFIHISDGKTHEIDVLDLLAPEPGAFYLLDRGDTDFDRLHALHEAGSFFVIRAKRNLRFKRRYSQPVARRARQARRVPDQQHESGSTNDRRVVPASLAGGVVLQVDQAALAHQGVLRDQRERGEDANLDRSGHLCADRHREEALDAAPQPVRNPTNPEPDDVRVNPDKSTTCKAPIQFGSRKRVRTTPPPMTYVGTLMIWPNK